MAMYGLLIVLTVTHSLQENDEDDDDDDDLADLEDVTEVLDFLNENLDDHMDDNRADSDDYDHDDDDEDDDDESSDSDSDFDDDVRFFLASSSDSSYHSTHSEMSE